MKAQGPAMSHPAAQPRWHERLAAALRRLALATLAGLVLAGIVHIVTILLIPVLSDRDATSAYLALGSAGKAETISTEAGDRPLPSLREADPVAATAVCGYDLGDGPIRVVAHTGALPLGLTVHRRGGGVLYAITDRAAIRGTIEFIVLTEQQLSERIARDDQGEAARELRILSDTSQGLIVARALAKLPSDRSDAEALATGVACGAAD